MDILKKPLGIFLIMKKILKERENTGFKKKQIALPVKTLYHFSTYQ